MRSLIAAGAAILLVGGCGGSSTNGTGDGGSSSGGSSSSSGAGSGGSSSSSGAGSSSSSGGGSCPMVSGTYLFHWTYVSGGTLCQTGTPADKTSVVDEDAGIAVGDGCTTTVTGCTYNVTCTPDAGTDQITETITINSDGSITGSATASFSITLAGTTMTLSCAYSMTSTKQ